MFVWLHVIGMLISRTDSLINHCYVCMWGPDRRETEKRETERRETEKWETEMQ